MPKIDKDVAQVIVDNAINKQSLDALHKRLDELSVRLDSLIESNKTRVTKEDIEELKNRIERLENWNWKIAMMGVGGGASGSAIIYGIMKLFGM